MKYIFLLFLSMILPVFSLKEIKPKYCFNCKYFMPNTNEVKFGKCSAFPKKVNDDDFLVTGTKEDKIIEFSFCSTARSTDNMCGIEGLMHKRKYIKKGEQVTHVNKLKLF